MNSCEWAEEVALLEPPTAALAAHLASCADCRELLEDLRADQSLLADPPNVPQGVVAAAVHRRLAVRRVRWLVPAVAVAAAAGFVLYFSQTQMLLPPLSRPAPIPVARVVQPAPLVTVRAVTPTSRPVQSRRRSPGDPDKLMASLEAMLRESSRATASADTPVLITTQTADPDVVIVLVPERTGDEDD